MTEIRTRHDGLSVDEAAEDVGVTPQTIRNWIARGLLPATRIGPGRTSPHRIKPEDLDKVRGSPRHPPGTAWISTVCARLDVIADGLDRDRREPDKVLTYVQQLRRVIVDLEQVP